MENLGRVYWGDSVENRKISGGSNYAVLKKHLRVFF
jgi:hypothetical protein